MRRFLSYKDKAGRQQLAELGGGLPLFVGRDGRCQIQFNDPTLSGEHCRLLCDGAQCFVEDLGSTNGTYVNERRIPVRKGQALQPDDVVRCGALKLRFVVAVQADAATQVQLPKAAQTGPREPERAGTTRPQRSLPAQPTDVLEGQTDESRSETCRQLVLQQRLRSKALEELQGALRCIRQLQGEREGLQRAYQARQGELLDARNEIRELRLLIDSVRQEHAQAAAHWQQLLRSSESSAAQVAKERSELLAHAADLGAQFEGLKVVSAAQAQQITTLKTELLEGQRRLEDLLPKLEHAEFQLAELRTRNEDALRKAERRLNDALVEGRQLRQELEQLLRSPARALVS